MDKTNIKTNSENYDDSSECFRLDMRQFLHINVDKDKMKDELEGLSDYNNIYEYEKSLENDKE